MPFLSEPTLLVACIEVVIGVLLLAKAADEFVDGAAHIATKARLSPVLVGALIVGFGTSAPELLVSSLAAQGGNAELGFGNIIGSNVANLSLVLGAAAIIVPVLVTRAVLGREAPLSLMAVLLFAALAYWGGLTRLDGLILAVALVASLSWIIAGGRGVGEEDDDEDEAGPLRAEIVRTIVGLVGTVAGAQLLVWGAQGIAEEFGLKGGFVGFTLVAVGTSLPELMTGIAAARRKATDLLLGNLLGSNIFNSLAVGTAIALLGPGPMGDEGLRSIGLVVMVLVAIGAVVAMATRRRVHRVEGAALLAAWVIAVILLAQNGTDPAGEALAYF
ncbi:MAG: calcium/sodium antiporter [Actinomycetota bacterium]